MAARVARKLTWEEVYDAVSDIVRKCEHFFGESSECSPSNCDLFLFCRACSRVLFLLRAAEKLAAEPVEES